MTELSTNSGLRVSLVRNDTKLFLTLFWTLCWWKFLLDIIFENLYLYFLLSEAVARRCSLKKVCLKFLQNSQGNTRVGVSIWWSYRPAVCKFIKKQTAAFCFSVNFTKSVKTFLYSTSSWLLLCDIIRHCCLQKMYFLISFFQNYFLVSSSSAALKISKISR